VIIGALRWTSIARWLRASVQTAGAWSQTTWRRVKVSCLRRAFLWFEDPDLSLISVIEEVINDNMLVYILIVVLGLFVIAMSFLIIMLCE